jgi:hypothetical protein
MPGDTIGFPKPERGPVKLAFFVNIQVDPYAGRDQIGAPLPEHWNPAQRNSLTLWEVLANRYNFGVIADHALKNGEIISGKAFYLPEGDSGEEVAAVRAEMFRRHPDLFGQIPEIAPDSVETLTEAQLAEKVQVVMDELYPDRVVTRNSHIA